MKLLLMLMMFLLCGCTASETLETIADEPIQAVMAQPREISVRLPDNAVAPVLEGETEQVYMSEDYEIVIETLSAGDLDATMRSICGYERNQLTVMETQWDNVTRYDLSGPRQERRETVWAARWYWMTGNIITV